MEYQRIRCFSRFAACQYGALLVGVPGTCGAGPRGVSFGTLLGPEATGPYLAAMREGGRNGFLLFPHPFNGGARLCGAGGGDGVVV